MESPTEKYLRKILEHARDGQNGSASYAFDRLVQIEKITRLALGRLKQIRKAA